VKNLDPDYGTCQVMGSANDVPVITSDRPGSLFFKEKQLVYPTLNFRIRHF